MNIIRDTSLSWLISASFLLTSQPVYIWGEPLTGLVCAIGNDAATTLDEGSRQFPPRNSSSKHQQHPQSPLTACPFTSNDATANLDAIEKMVNSFYKANADKSNVRVDAGFGLDILHAQLKYLLAKQGHKLSPNLKSRIGQLHQSSGALASNIFDHVVKRVGEINPSRVEGLEAIRQNLHFLTGTHDWHQPSAITKHFHEFKNVGNELEEIDGALDYQCLSSLMKDCSVSQICKVPYMEDISSQYMLTHQSIYQHFAEQRSCSSTNPDEFEDAGMRRDQLCSKAYLEAEFLADRGFPTRFVDLFAEYVGVCGMMGYPNFIRADWLQEILSWREGSATGCMSDLYGDHHLSDTSIRVVAAGREDGASEEDCLVHLTSVALMALSANFRYMVEVCEPSLFEA